MIKFIVPLLFFAGGFASVGDSAALPAEVSAGPLSFLERLYEDHRYFELRDALFGMKDASDVALEFYRGVVDEVFNRLDSAIGHLRAYLEGGGRAGRDRPLAQKAWVSLADAFRRAGRYRESAEAQKTILDLFGSGLDEDEKANRENQLLLWSAVADVPPMSVEVPGDSTLLMDNRLFPVRIEGREYAFAYDTGGSLSVLYESAAKELGLALRGRGAKIESATGRWIDSRLAVVPEMSLGRAVIRNAVFLVLPDDFFPVRKNSAGKARRGVIGAPVLAALKELAETSDGRLFLPAAPRPRAVQNMFFFGFKPVVEIIRGTDRFCLFMDTGSAVTFLYPRYFRRNQKEIEARSAIRQITMGGAGGERKVAVHVLDEFAFRAGGRALTLKKVMVHTEVTNSISEIFDGTLGRDVLAPGLKMTLNFESMSFLVEEDLRKK